MNTVQVVSRARVAGVVVGKLARDGLRIKAHDEDHVTLAIEALSEVGVTPDARVGWITVDRGELPPAGPVEQALGLEHAVLIAGAHPRAGSMVLAQVLALASITDLVVATDTGGEQDSAVAVAIPALALRGLLTRRTPGVAPVDPTGDAAAERLHRLPHLSALLTDTPAGKLYATAITRALRKSDLELAQTAAKSFAAGPGMTALLDLRAALGDDGKGAVASVDAHGAIIIEVDGNALSQLEPPEELNHLVYDPEVPALEQAVPAFLRSFEDKIGLIAGECSGCGELVFPRRRRCPECGELVKGRRSLSRHGILHTLTEIHVPVSGRESPYVIGMVVFPEGPRALCPLAGGEPVRGELDSTVELVLRRFQTSGGIPDWTWAYRPKKEA